MIPEQTGLDETLEIVIEKSKRAEEGLGKNSDSNRKLADSERETAKNVRTRSIERLSKAQKEEVQRKRQKRRKENTHSKAVQYSKEKVTRKLISEKTNLH